MQEELQITCRNFEADERIERRVREEFARLERYYPRILGGRVLLELAHRHHTVGNRFTIRIDIALPGEDIVVNHRPDLHGTMQDLEIERTSKQLELEPERRHLIVAIDEAFETARRRLQDYAKRQRGDVKTHEPPPHGRVVRMDIAEGYGFIEASDGREIYFHRNSVLGDGFDDLEVGASVIFSEEQGERGPQASTVRRVRASHAVAG